MYPTSFKYQPQDPPGIEAEMQPKPIVIREDYVGSGKLKGKVALITGGDSGIGRAVAVHFAKEGADIAIVYLNEHVDAEDTRAMVEAEGRRFFPIAGDLGDPEFCRRAVHRTADELGRLDILVNNAAEQMSIDKIAEITPEQLRRTFQTNIFSFFYLTAAAMSHLRAGATVINTTSVTAYEGSGHLLDYASTKGAIVSFTRSLAEQVAKKGIRVNAVAPGPIWTPLQTYSQDKSHIEKFGKDTLLGRAGQPAEVAPAYVYLASEDSSYVTGQTIHVNGGKVTNG